MKAIIILSLVAIACAVPVDEKKPVVGLAPLAPNNQNTASKSPYAPVVAAAPLKPKRDTQQKAPQPTLNAQKTPSNVNAPKTATVADTSKNARPSRDTQKSAPVPTAGPQVKKTETAAPAQNSRKTRDVAKQVAADAAKPTTFDHNVNAQKAPTPQLVKVPLTSTNSRSKRDAPKPSEQSKIVPSNTGVKTDSAPAVKANNAPAATSPVVKPKRDTVNPQLSSSNNGQAQIKRPAPVDQILKQKAAAAPEAPKASDAKPIVKS